MSVDVGVKPPLPEPVYLGDGLFARFDGYQVELYASNGIAKTNVVYLDPGVLNAFLDFVKQLKRTTG